MQLTEHGRLKLDDPVSKYYSEAPAIWEKITLRHLLNHTSGIPSYTGLPNFPGKLCKVDRTPRETIQLTQNEPLQFELGSQFAYNNTGYVLLGYAIEMAAGQSFAEYLREHIFEPLGMRNTGYDDSATVLLHRASGYRTFNGFWENAPYIAMSLPHAAGGLYSTTGDLLLWDRALTGGKVLNPQSMETMFTDCGHGYGLGWTIEQQYNRRLEKHNGSINGFHATFERYPDEGLTIVVLLNIENSPTDLIARELARLKFGIAERGAGVHVDPALFDKYAGDYRLGPNFIMTITREGDRLFSQATGQRKFELFPESLAVYFPKLFDARITFETDEHGRATSLVIHQSGRDVMGMRIG